MQSTAFAVVQPIDRLAGRGDPAPRRLCVFLPSLRGGGAERAMVGLANGFVAAGHAVDLVLAKAQGPYLAQADPRLTIVDLDRRGVLDSIVPLARYLRRSRPDALLSAMSHANLAAIAAHALARVPTRLVISERTDAVEMVRTLRRWRDRLILVLMRLSYRRADALIAVARALVPRAASYGIDSSRISVIYNPVVSPALLERAREPADHPWLAGEGGEPVILAVGRLGPEKDFGTLVESFALLRRRIPARLIILGEGGERPALEQRVRSLGIEPLVSLAGFAPNPHAYMRRAALFVLSSRFEGLPGALIEAMACGTPVVSTDCPTGPAEILEEGRWGRLVPVGDVVALADAMEASLRATDHPDVTIRAGDFDSATAIRQYLAVLLPDCANRAKS